ncbi:CDP-glucose 4,6-dehydratase [Halalkalibacter krulwichiae]|uniref:CDP-glucose 4,6-dehydratase n=2 Tax=Halalkalibacter krulwichiae TaxID=199441 RepID=A0A1X9MC68_9BACI|nr:CDP-glucose 4,6-dehydratase [Halalkalibacter krulwichiae]ARK29743.1 CDP-glucose 4,6-dehydratase [Halalkalibacter krulwichiae]
MVDKEFWKGKKVFLTGHTGFKGTWLSLWLTSMGAHVTGYALAPPTSPSLFELTNLENIVDSYIGDINDYKELQRLVSSVDPDIVFHMAAQPIVGDSYKEPVATFQTNVIGTVNILEAVYHAVTEGSKVRAVVNVTTDKCYQNKNWYWGYRENEPLGGNDPYSASKACSELVTNSYRKSFFSEGSKVAIASARAGNVIGGGDWSPERLIPQCLKSLLNEEPIILRKPNAVRPWQHVLEPLSGYLLLAEKLHTEGQTYAQAWNFGPDYNDCKEVGVVVNRLIQLWGKKIPVKHLTENLYAESDLLMLDCSKSKSLLSWKPIWTLEHSLYQIVKWTKVYQHQGDVREVTLKQISEYMKEIQKRQSLDE